MEDEQFEQLVDAGITAIPERIRANMQNVAIVIEDEPGEQHRGDYEYGEGGEIFGFYEGIPLPERGIDYGHLPDKITIFKGPILRTYSSPEDIAACVSNTVWHEIAHHFGYGEEWVAQEEQNRGKTL